MRTSSAEKSAPAAFNAYQDVGATQDGSLLRDRLLGFIFFPFRTQIGHVDAARLIEHDVGEAGLSILLLIVGHSRAAVVYSS